MNPSSVEKQSHRLVARYFEACNRHDMAAVMACYHPDVVHHSRLSQYPKAGIAFAFDATFQAFPDLRWTVLETIAEGDRVASLTLIEGTHDGDYLGTSGTGRHVRIYSADVARVRDGQFIAHRGIIDELHLLAQIGVVPEMFLAQMS